MPPIPHVNGCLPVGFSEQSRLTKLGIPFDDESISTYEVAFCGGEAWQMTIPVEGMKPIVIVAWEEDV